MESQARPSQESGQISDRRAIEELIAAMTAGFNTHDARASTAMYLNDAYLVTVRGEVMKGRAAFEEGLAAVFRTRARDATLTTLECDIQFIRSDVALVHVTNELSGLISPEGETLPSHNERSLRVLVKEDGRWRVAAFHNTMVRPFGE